MRGFSFSWKRALGITAAKQKFARATGIPTSKGGLERKIGKSVLGSLLTTVAAGAVVASDNESNSKKNDLVDTSNEEEKENRVINNRNRDRKKGCLKSLLWFIPLLSIFSILLSGSSNKTKRRKR